MTKNSHSIQNILQTLRDGNMTEEQTSVLTYIRSDFGKTKLLNTIDKTQYVELCKLLFELVSIPNKSEMNMDPKKKNVEAEITLCSVLKSFDHHINIFEMVSHIDRKERLRALKFLNNIEIHILTRMTLDSMSADAFDDCLQMVQPSVMEWLAASACTDNIQLLIDAETRILSQEQDYEEQLILCTLTLLHRLYEYAAANSSDFNIQPIHPVVFERVISLAYMGHKRQRAPALKVLNQALNTNLMSHIKNRHSSLWTQYKNTLQNTYCSRMSLLVRATQYDWSHQWSLSIKMLGIDLHRGADLINNLLSVEEKAFKSTDMNVRKEAFESWKHLIDNFALNATELATSRRIKLLCIPLNAKNSKIEIVAVTKLETWWHLIVKLYSNTDKLLNQVIEQFLNFCFGPLGDTPLLSTKCEVVASPGKRFSNTKLLALDALLQLLVQKPIDRSHIPYFMKERLSNAVPSVIFQTSYKSLFHSGGEAVLMINELNENELKNRGKLNEILWSNLMMYIQQSSAEQKSDMYKELILILKEVISHITDSSLIIDLLFNIILGKLIKVTQHLMYRDTTLMDLLLKLLSPGILRSADKKNFNDLIHLICHAIKPENVKMYHPHTLSFIKSVLTKMTLLIKHEINSCVFELWCTLTKIVIKYMEQNQRINEGTAIEYKFESIQLLIIFPIQNVFWCNPRPLIKIGKLWRELYKQFNTKADLITVKPNEILHNITTLMENSMLKNKNCYSVIAHCLDALMSTIDYETFVCENKIPPLIRMLRDITMEASYDMNVTVIEFSLKATSSLLMTVYGLNQKCALIYLDILKPSIEHILGVENTTSVEKEIINTWETVVIILRGLSSLLTYEFIISIQKTILLALRHKNCEIAAQAMSLISIESNLNKEAKTLFEEIEKMAQKSSTDNTPSTLENNDDSTKPVKITGSFFNRNISSPKTVIAIIKDCDTKKIRVPSPLPPSEPDTQDYIIIKNDVKLDINRLTEHQKESLKRRRDDIPAMYNDLSQSASRNAQQFEDWFKNKFEVRIDGEKNIMENAHNKIVMDGESNKENNVSRCIDVVDNTDETFNDLTTRKKLDEDKSSAVIETNQMEYNSVGKNDTNTQMSTFVDEKNGVDGQFNMNISNIPVPPTIAKKLNFGSPEKFLVEKDYTDSIAHCSIRLSVGECDKQLTQYTAPHVGMETLLSICGVEPNDRVESQSLESLHSIRRGRPRGTSVKVGEKSLRCTRLSNTCDGQSEQNLKRKISLDDESVRVLANKRRRCTEIPQLSSDPTCDTENIKSIESENHSAILPDEDLSKRTKKEMSRLQINMAFNSIMPSKLRSKSTDDFVYGSKTKRQKNIKYPTQSTSQNASSQELVKKHRKKETHSLPAVKVGSLTSVRTESLENNKVNSRIKLDDEIERNDEETFSNTVEWTKVTKINENSNINENGQVIHMCDDTETFNQNTSTKDSPKVNSNCDIVRNEDEEEVIESSQENNLLLRSPLRKNEQRCNSITFLTKTSPKKKILHEHENARNPLHEETNKTITAGVNFSSPKSIKRLSKTKIFTPQGRAAHMLGLVTKLAIGERDKSNNNIKYSEDEMNKKLKLPKELESDGALIKKERALSLKETDRIGSPSGSRQEKIFNNMKSKEYTSSPPSKLFSNLKNEGEKVSPKFERIKLIDSMKTSDKDQSIESNTSLECDELPMLEWSNTNPPLLTASPNASILKRQRQMSDINNDMTSNKRKRVSFADPPVSRKMGYEVISGSSTVKTNKFGQSRSSLMRKDTPIKIKQSKFRIIQIDAENSDQLLSNQSNKSTSTDIIEIDHTRNELLAKSADDFEENFDDCGVIQINATNFHDNKACKTSNKSGHIANSSIASIMAVDNAQAINKMKIVEMQLNSSTIMDEMILETHDATYQAISHKNKNNCGYNDLIVSKPEELFTSQINESHDSSKFNITDDPTIARILNGSSNNYKSNELEDTVDIQNVSNLNSTANSDELFCDKLARTSTQIAAMTAIAQGDTLPITDSMFLSEDSLVTQQNLALSQPHTLDITNPVCPILLDCKEPIDSIVDDLVNPLWAKNLSKYFVARNISTIGDFAQLSEREVARFPIKGSPKVNYIKHVLNNFAVSYLPSSDDETAKTTLTTTSNAVCNTPRTNEECTESVYEIFELDTKNYDLDDNNVTADITATSLSPVNQSLIDDEITERDIGIATSPLVKNIQIEKSNDYGSIILDTSISPTPKISMTMSQTEKLGTPLQAIVESASIAPIDHHISPLTTKSEGAQLNIQKVLDEIDPHLLLQSAIKRNTPEHILAQYKMKMNHKSEADFTKESLRLLGLEMYTETGLKNACHDYGVTKILGRLPGIFNADNQFFTKVLNTYRMKITADDCINALNLNEIKKALCKKCSSSELCEMLSTVLTNEERDSVNTPITEVASLNAMLKRMPMDTIISHTVANDELIPSSFVLEIALQNNNPETIIHALHAQFPNIVEKIIERNMSDGTIISYLDKSPLPKDKLLDIYRAVCDKLNPGQLLDVHNEVMKKKLCFLDIGESQ